MLLWLYRSTCRVTVPPEYSSCGGEQSDSGSAVLVDDVQLYSAHAVLWYAASGRSYNFAVVVYRHPTDVRRHCHG